MPKPNDSPPPTAEVRPAAAPESSATPAAPDKNANAIDVGFWDADSVLGTAAVAAKSVGKAVWNGFKAVGREAVMPALEKLISQGAAEIPQALYTGSGYVPYGPKDQLVKGEEGHGVHGPADVTPKVEAASAEANGYQVFDTPVELAPAHEKLEYNPSEYARISAPHDINRGSGRSR